MERYINPATGKTVLQINDEGKETLDKKFFDNVKRETSIDSGHAHTYTVDQYGTGLTAPAIDGGDGDQHTHKIVAWEVEEADGHSHTISKRTEDKDL